MSADKENLDRNNNNNNMNYEGGTKWKIILFLIKSHENSTYGLNSGKNKHITYMTLNDDSFLLNNMMWTHGGKVPFYSTLVYYLV